MEARDWYERLLLLYVGLLPFVRIALLPVVDAKVQPTELVFLPLLFFGWQRYGRSLWAIDPRLRWAGLAYLFWNLLSALVAWNLPAVLEACGRGYLLLVALLVAAYVRERGEAAVWMLLRYFLYGTTVLAFCTYLGYLAALFGYDNSMVQVYGNYPYLGTVLRAKGFTAGAGMLIIVLQLAVPYAWWGWRTGRLSLFWLAFLLPLAVLTLAKEVLLVGLGLALVDPWFRGLTRKWGRGPACEVRYGVGLVSAVAVVFWLGTHLILQARQPVAETSLAGTNYTSNELVWQGERWQLLETSYLSLKKAAVHVAGQYPVFGVGPGQFGRHLPSLKESGQYPAHLPDYDPHSTWLGALAETGV
ncbi:MAG: hypothetical protein AAFZ52_16685, partial [Bacteroidota bacterium]